MTRAENRLKTIKNNILKENPHFTPEEVEAEYLARQRSYASKGGKSINSRNGFTTPEQARKAQKASVKARKCKHCGSESHLTLKCFNAPRKPIVSKSKGVKKSKTVSKSKKTETRSQLVKKLDAVFSKYIRLSEAGSDGFGNCITCGKNIHWKEAQACHFYTRGRYPTRWDEDNVHFGCYRCNVLLKGNYINYTRWMLDSYSPEFVDKLEFKSLNGEKISTPDLRDKIAYYTDEVNKMLALFA